MKRLDENLHANSTKKERVTVYYERSFNTDANNARKMKHEHTYYILDHLN